MSWRLAPLNRVNMPLITGHRLGDNAEMCFIELVDYDENMAKTATAKKATRTRRSKKSAAATEAPAAPAAETTEEAPKAE